MSRITKNTKNPMLVIIEVYVESAMNESFIFILTAVFVAVPNFVEIKDALFILSDRISTLILPDVIVSPSLRPVIVSRLMNIKKAKIGNVKHNNLKKREW